MTRKITLSIPDMLHEKLEGWRKSFNLSKMFQDALSDAIQKKEEFHKRLQDDLSMSETIERLKLEKRLSEGNYAENGRIEGFRWAKSAHYDDLMYALSFDSPAAMANDERLSASFGETIASDYLMEQAGEELNKHTKLFLEGWLKGVDEFWNEIKEKL
jgi:hypothetical protein